MSNHKDKNNKYEHKRKPKSCDIECESLERKYIQKKITKKMHDVSSNDQIYQTQIHQPQTHHCQIHHPPVNHDHIVCNIPQDSLEHLPICEKQSPVYGEFIRTFTLSGPVQLPIVQPNGSIPFPIPVVQPRGVKYIDQGDRVGLLVPRGIYLVSWTLNPIAPNPNPNPPNVKYTIDLLVNGKQPVTINDIPFTYARSIVPNDGTTSLNVSYLVSAPNLNNLISLVNSGEHLFGLHDIPYTRINSTAVVTHIRVQRID